MQTDAIKISTSISQPFVIAGSPFTLTTTITNVHQSDIEVLDFVYHVPYQVQWIHDQTYIREYATYNKKNWIAKLFTRSPWKIAAAPPGEPMVYAFMGSAAAPTAPVTAPGTQPIPTANAPAANQPAIFVVPPGEGATYSFKAIVPSWLFISGGQLAFQGSMRYRCNGAEHKSLHQVTFPYRPPLMATGIGSVIGALIGSVARALKENGVVVLQQLFGEKNTAALPTTFASNYVVATALAVILSVVAVVYASRRTDTTQPVITVEDFFGGVLVGFALGYLGQEFFQRVVPLQ